MKNKKIIIGVLTTVVAVGVVSLLFISITYSVVGANVFSANESGRMEFQVDGDVAEVKEGGSTALALDSTSLRESENHSGFSDNLDNFTSDGTALQNFDQTFVK